MLKKKQKVSDENISILAKRKLDFSDKSYLRFLSNDRPPLASSNLKKSCVVKK